MSVRKIVQCRRLTVVLQIQIAMLESMLDLVRCFLA